MVVCYLFTTNFIETSLTIHFTSWKIVVLPYGDVQLHAKYILLMISPRENKSWQRTRKMKKINACHFKNNQVKNLQRNLSCTFMKACDRQGYNNFKGVFLRLKE